MGWWMNCCYMYCIAVTKSYSFLPHKMLSVRERTGLDILLNSYWKMNTNILWCNFIFTQCAHKNHPSYYGVGVL